MEFINLKAFKKMKKEKTQRQLQVNERIKRSIAQIFVNSGLTTIKGCHVTISEADISPDMKNCKIFINIFGDQNLSQEIVRQINLNAPQFKRALSSDLTMKSTPNLIFSLDESSLNAQKISSLIDEESKKF